jgi:hypothetical protein
MWYLLRFFLKPMPDNDQAVLIEERKDPEDITSYLYPDFVGPFTFANIQKVVRLNNFI